MPVPPRQQIRLHRHQGEVVLGVGTLAICRVISQRHAFQFEQGQDVHHSTELIHVHRQHGVSAE